MGDRAIVLFEEDDQVEGFAVYFHWAGQDGVESLYKKTLSFMDNRSDDVGYFAARFVGLAHEEMPGKTGLGLLPAPKDGEDMRTYSHGDAGVCILSPSKGAFRWVEGTGYAARKDASK